MTAPVDTGALRELLERLRKSGDMTSKPNVFVDAAETITALLAEVERRRADEAELVGALKKLTLMARTSGGTAGRDDGLCAACDAAEALLAKVKDSA